MTESLISPELLPDHRLAVFDKFDINAIAPNLDAPLSLRFTGEVPFDPRRSQAISLTEPDKRIAIRNINVVNGEIQYQLTYTTMGLYESYHDLYKKEGLRNLELAMPLGGCVIVLTADNRMIVQLRSQKHEYMHVPGASAGAIISAQFDRNGQQIPVERVLSSHVADVVNREVGLKPDQYQLFPIAFVIETFPKAHHELVSVARTNLRFEELKQQFINNTGITNPDFVALPADPETIKVLVSGIDCPLPPTHAGAFISYGYILVKEQSGQSEADHWLDELTVAVSKNYRRLDEQVASDSRHPHRYIPILRPSHQGLQDTAAALLRAGLLVPIGNTNESRILEEILKPSEVCISGGVHFPKFSEHGSSDHLRGQLVLKNVSSLLDSGYKVSINITSNTNDEYTQLLEQLREKYPNNLKLDYEIPRGEKTSISYSEARRRAAEVSKSLSVRYIVTCELEKDLQDFFSTIKDNGAGFHILDRNMEKMKTGLPFWQNAFEHQQNTAITIHHINAGFLPKDAKPWDELNGTRVVSTELMPTNIPGLQIRPSDLMNLRYSYENPDDDPGLNINFGGHWYHYSVDHYTAAVYHPLTLAAALGIGVDPVSYNYKHDPKQTKLEESESYEAEFKAKRIAQARAIIDQNFDLVANICQWKAEGRWPGIITDAINNKTPITLKHFSSLDWKITNGRLVAI